MSLLYLLVGAILLLTPQFSSFEQKEVDDKTETLLYIEDQFGGHYEEIKEVPHQLDGIKTLLYIEDEVDGHYEVEGADGATYLIYEQKSPIIPFYNSGPLGENIPSFLKKPGTPSFWHYLTIIFLMTSITIFLDPRALIHDSNGIFTLFYGFALTCLTSYLYFGLNKKFPTLYKNLFGMVGLWFLNLSFTSILVIFFSYVEGIIHAILLYRGYNPIQLETLMKINFFLAIGASFVTLIWLFTIEIRKKSLSKKITPPPVADLSLLPATSSSAIDPKLPLAKVA